MSAAKLCHFFTSIGYCIHATGSIQSTLSSNSPHGVHKSSNLLLKYSELTIKVLSLYVWGHMLMGRQKQDEISLTTSKVKSGKTTQSMSPPPLLLFSVGDYRKKSITLKIHKFSCIT